MSKKDETRQLALDALCNRPPVKHLFSPLDYIFAEHFRQRVLCGVLDDFTKDKTHDPELMIAAVNYLKQEMNSHIQDEEDDLFPLLRLRSEQDDGIDQVLDQLSEEHKSDHIDALQIIEKLRLALKQENNSGLQTKFAESMHRFTANERRHLIVENAIIIPLARVRLKQDDLNQMSQHMANRRGIVLPEKDLD